MPDGKKQIDNKLTDTAYYRVNKAMMPVSKLPPLTILQERRESAEFAELKWLHVETGKALG